MFSVLKVGEASDYCWACEEVSYSADAELCAAGVWWCDYYVAVYYSECCDYVEYVYASVEVAYADAGDVAAECYAVSVAEEGECVSYAVSAV